MGVLIKHFSLHPSLIGLTKAFIYRMSKMTVYNGNNIELRTGNIMDGVESAWANVITEYLPVQGYRLLVNLPSNATFRYKISAYTAQKALINEQIIERNTTDKFVSFNNQKASFVRLTFFDSPSLETVREINWSIAYENT